MIPVLAITAVVVAIGHVLERLHGVPFLSQYRSLIFAAILLYSSAARFTSSSDVTPAITVPGRASLVGVTVRK